MKRRDYHFTQLMIVVMFYVRLGGAMALCVVAGLLIHTWHPQLAVIGALCIAAALCMVPSHKHARDYAPL